jgi:hypothetical protein
LSWKPLVDVIDLALEVGDLLCQQVGAFFFAPVPPFSSRYGHFQNRRRRFWVNKADRLDPQCFGAGVEHHA